MSADDEYFLFLRDEYSGLYYSLESSCKNGIKYKIFLNCENKSFTGNYTKFCDFQETATFRDWQVITKKIWIILRFSLKKLFFCNFPNIEGYAILELG